MHICLDARLYKETGVGRYIRSLLKYLPDIDKENNYSLLMLPEDCDKFQIPNSQWKIIPAPARWHSLREQFIIPQILSKEKPDLVHFPYFNVPIFYQGKFIVTIHDLTILNMATGKSSNHSPFIYFLKRQGFLQVLKHAIYNSQKIITVSYTVKKEILNNFKIPAEKIIVTYEAGNLEVEEKIGSINLDSRLRRNDKLNNYLLYVGNAHPHKNLEKLLDAFSLVTQKQFDLKLILVGNDDYFYQRIKGYIKKLNLENKVMITGPVPNSSLKTYYQKAKAYIFPSLSEGFGIPGLEAMSLNCPVLASDIPIFREIYQDAACYFNPKEPSHIADKIIEIINKPGLKEDLVQKGQQRYQEFSWQKMTEETLKIYKSVLNG